MVGIDDIALGLTELHLIANLCFDFTPFEKFKDASQHREYLPVLDIDS